MEEELKRLNPKVRFEVRDTAVSPVNIIYADVPGESLKLPEGYFFNGKDSISNKGNTDSGVYECFAYEWCDAAHFNRLPKKEQAKTTKKSIFARLFAK